MASCIRTTWVTALAVCTALTAVCKLINADLITAVLGPVLKLLDHPKELVSAAVARCTDTACAP